MGRFNVVRRAGKAVIKLMLVKKISNIEDFRQSTAELAEKMDEWGVYSGLAGPDSETLVSELEEQIAWVKEVQAAITNYVDRKDALRRSLKVIRNEAFKESPHLDKQGR